MDAVLLLSEYSVHEDHNLRDGTFILMKSNNGKGDYLFQGTTEGEHKLWLDILREQIAESANNPNAVVSSSLPTLRQRTSMSSFQSRRFFKGRKKEEAAEPQAKPKVFGLLLRELQDSEIDQELFVPKIVVQTASYLEHCC